MPIANKTVLPVETLCVLFLTNRHEIFVACALFADAVCSLCAAVERQIPRGHQHLVNRSGRTRLKKRERQEFCSFFSMGERQ
jgi:hypothetical protein